MGNCFCGESNCACHAKSLKCEGNRNFQRETEEIKKGHLNFEDLNLSTGSEDSLYLPVCPDFDALYPVSHDIFVNSTDNDVSKEETTPLEYVLEGLKIQYNVSKDECVSSEEPKHELLNTLTEIPAQFSNIGCQFLHDNSCSINPQPSIDDFRVLEPKHDLISSRYPFPRDSQDHPIDQRTSNDVLQNSREVQSFRKNRKSSAKFRKFENQDVDFAPLKSKLSVDKIISKQNNKFESLSKEKNADTQQCTQYSENNSVSNSFERILCSQKTTICDIDPAEFTDNTEQFCVSENLQTQIKEIGNSRNIFLGGSLIENIDSSTSAHHGSSENMAKPNNIISLTGNGIRSCSKVKETLHNPIEDLQNVDRTSDSKNMIPNKIDNFANLLMNQKTDLHTNFNVNENDTLTVLQQESSAINKSNRFNVNRSKYLMKQFVKLRNRNYLEKESHKDDWKKLFSNETFSNQHATNRESSYDSTFRKESSIKTQEKRFGVSSSGSIPQLEYSDNSFLQEFTKTEMNKFLSVSALDTSLHDASIPKSHIMDPIESNFPFQETIAYDSQPQVMRNSKYISGQSVNELRPRSNSQYSIMGIDANKINEIQESIIAKENPCSYVTPSLIHNSKTFDKESFVHRDDIDKVLPFSKCADNLNNVGRTRQTSAMSYLHKDENSAGITNETLEKALSDQAFCDSDAVFLYFRKPSKRNCLSNNDIGSSQALQAVQEKRLKKSLISRHEKPNTHAVNRSRYFEIVRMANKLSRDKLLWRNRSFSDVRSFTKKNMRPLKEIIVSKQRSCTEKNLNNRANFFADGFVLKSDSLSRSRSLFKSANLTSNDRSLYIYKQKNIVSNEKMGFEGNIILEEQIVGFKPPIVTNKKKIKDSEDPKSILPPTFADFACKNGKKEIEGAKIARKTGNSTVLLDKCFMDDTACGFCLQGSCFHQFMVKHYSSLTQMLPTEQIANLREINQLTGEIDDNESTCEKHFPITLESKIKFSQKRFFDQKSASKLKKESKGQIQPKSKTTDDVNVNQLVDFFEKYQDLQDK